MHSASSCGRSRNQPQLPSQRRPWLLSCHQGSRRHDHSLQDHSHVRIVTNPDTTLMNASATQPSRNAGSRSTHRNAATCASPNGTPATTAATVAHAYTVNGLVDITEASVQRSLAGWLLPVHLPDQRVLNLSTRTLHLHRQPAPSRLTSPQDRRKSVCKLPRRRWRTLGNNSRR